MKENRKILAVVILLAIKVLSIITSLDYYKYLFTNLFNNGYYGGIWAPIEQLFYLLVNLFEWILIGVFLSSSGLYQDKAYKLLRYFFLMGFFLYIPYTIYYYITSGGEYLQKAPLMQQVLQYGSLLGQIVCVVLFIMAKPKTQPAAIDLSEYELVSYTSTGHRFVHRLLDLLFLVPVYVFWQRILPRVWEESLYMAEVLMLILYLTYCFLSEAIFRQTLGKIVTGSCVASTGNTLTTGRILRRTMARMIPFDNISFLFGANWHDKTNNTTVVYIDTWEKVFDGTDVKESPTTTYP